MNVYGKKIIGDRDSQQDNLLILNEKVKLTDGKIATLCVVADGMGGVKGGQYASQIVVETFKKLFSNENISKNSLLSTLHKSNKNIITFTAENPKFKGMGTTVVAVLITNHSLHWLSVGDSPLWLYRKGELQRLNEDHSMLPVLLKMAKMGQMSQQAALTDKSRSTLRSVVNGNEIKIIDVNETVFELKKGDVLLLASDGLDTLSKEVIESIIKDNVNSSSQVLTDKLLVKVNQANVEQQDNTTVIVIKTPSTRFDSKKVTVLFLILFITTLMGLGSYFGYNYYSKNKELTYWESLDISKKENCQEYLEKYPDGLHKEAANAAIKKINIQEAKIESDRLNKENYGSGLELLNNKKYDEAIKKFKLASDNNHNESTYQLAKIYADVPEKKNDNKAIELYRKAAANNHPESQFELAKHLSKDQEKISEEVINWYKKSAELEYDKAQYALAELYKEGITGQLDKNLQKAFELYQKAANQEHEQAKYELALAYYEGIGIKKSYTKAKEWFLKCKDHKDAEYYLGEIYQMGYKVDINMIEAFIWYKRSAEHGNANSQIIIAQMYQEGDVIPVDIDKANNWLTSAAEVGKPSAQFQKGVDYQFGRNTEIDLTKAIKWYIKSAEHDNIKAQRQLGWIYTNMEDVKNPEKAKLWYKKAANLGDKYSQNKLN